MEEAQRKRTVHILLVTWSAKRMALVVRKSGTSGNACVIFACISAHTEKLITNDGAESVSPVLTKRKREQKAAFNAVATNTLARLSNILPTGFVVHFVVDRLEKVWDR